MRKSLRDIERLEAFINGRLPAEEAQQLHTQLLLHPAQYRDWLAQKEAYALIRTLGRRQLKTELQAIHHGLQQDVGKRNWWGKIQRLFA